MSTIHQGYGSPGPHEPPQPSLASSLSSLSSPRPGCVYPEVSQEQLMQQLAARHMAQAHPRPLELSDLQMLNLASGTVVH